MKATTLLCGLALVLSACAGSVRLDEGSRPAMQRATVSQSAVVTREMTVQSTSQGRNPE